MSNEFSIAGAQAKPTKYAPLWQETFSQGLVTQRNPLRPGNGSSLMNKLYGGRNDAFLDGLNVEISNRLTPVRRPGSSVYNSQSFPIIDNFYEFRIFNSNTETIKVIADTSPIIWDATGPSTKTNIFTKSAGAGEAYFQSVGNTLYFGDGVDQRKWVQSAFVWTALTTFAPGTFIVDTNGNLQVATTSGLTGATQPSWNATRGATTTDAGQSWVNHGSALELWGIVAPANAPVVTQQAITGFGTWAANVFYTTTGLSGTAAQSLILDGSSNVQQIQSSAGAPQTGSSTPTFSGILGGTTVDGTITWVNLGPSAWQASHAYSLNNIVVATASGNDYFFRCVTAGTSGTIAPPWTDAVYFNVADNTVLWENVGITSLNVWADITASTVINGTGSILASDGSEQTIVASGKSGSVQPTWNTTIGGTTVDNTAIWETTAALSPASTGAWYYAYAYKNLVTGNVSNASPVSSPITKLVNNQVLIQGFGSSDPQVDTVVIYRTVQGGSPATLLLLAEIPNTSVWTYTDTAPDTSLNNLILANIAFSANPPPAGLVKMTYHLGRIWGVVNNSVYFSAGPDSTNGNGNEQFPPANVFVFPDQVNRLYPSALGLFVFTVSDVYLISGTTTASFFSVPYLIGLGLQNYNAWTVNGATVYMFTTDYQVVSFDLGTGVSEVGFPIGDQFLQAPWSPATARLTYHVSGSPDKGLYVSDFHAQWYRLYPTPAPETGMTWAPKATFSAGISQVQSVETAPGVHNLLIANATAGPILKRDSTVFTDGGANYSSNFTFGSIVLAQPGQLAELVFLTTDSIATGKRPLVSVQLDEITPFSGGGFENLQLFGPDPPQLQPSTSMFSQRFYFSQTQKPAVCRSLQIHVDWGIDTVQNELLSLTIFGGFSSEL